MEHAANHWRNLCLSRSNIYTTHNSVDNCQFMISLIRRMKTNFIDIFCRNNAIYMESFKQLCQKLKNDIVNSMNQNNEASDHNDQILVNAQNQLINTLTVVISEIH